MFHSLNHDRLRRLFRSEHVCKCLPRPHRRRRRDDLKTPKSKKKALRKQLQHLVAAIRSVPAGSRFDAGLRSKALLLPLLLPYLRMPNCGEVPEENIRAALGPAYCGQPPSKCRDTYQSTGVRLFNILPLVIVDQSRRSICSFGELPVIAHRTVTGEVPTHVFVVHEQRFHAQSNVHGSRKVLLLPFHAIVVASHCARLPPLVPSPIINDSQATIVPMNQPIRLTLPVVIIGVPNLRTFPKVVQYLYLRQVKFLYATFLPTPSTRFPDAFNEAGVNQPSLKRNDPDDLAKSFFTHPLNSARQDEFAKELSQTCSAYQILKKLRLIQRIWKNVVALGILDPVLWAVMRGCYEVLVRAFASCFQIEMEMILTGLED